MDIGKKIARKIIFPALMKLRVDEFIRKLDPHFILNVMYHGVVENDGTYFSPRHIEKKQFEKQLIFYKNNFDIISVAEAFYLRQNKIKPKRKTITISFDDGFKNNLYIASPLLEKHGIKSTYFISSVCSEEMSIRCLWPELIAALNYFYKDQIIESGGFAFKNLVDVETGLNLNDLLRTLPNKNRDAMLGDLTTKYMLNEKLDLVPEDLWKLLTKEELIKLSESSLVEIGSHGHLHYNLGNIDINDAIIELRKSKDTLEETIQKEVNMFAYPHGSYTEEVKNEAERTGYKYQLAVNYKYQSDLNDQRLLNRHGISSTTTFESNMLTLSKAFRNKGH